MAHDERPHITITVMWASAPHEIDCETLTLPAGATVADARDASRLLRQHLPKLPPEADGAAPAGPGALRLGLWGRLCTPTTRLQDQDRLELLRPLLLDPMEARRQRHRRDGLRAPRRSPRRPSGA